MLEVGGRWELHTVPAAQLGPLRPPARHSHVAAPLGHDSWMIFGGTGLRGPLADVWSFDTQVGLVRGGV